ncbi:MAG: thioredoxin family protein [Methanobacteriota archaeon]|nr:MAG: thioredoxin family protein [Euryarchaeota archaeon]
MELTQYQGLPLGSPAPDFSLPGVDGKTHSLGSFKDKPILVIAFWCNHCPYVQAWEDRTIAVQKEFAGKGVQFVMINANDDESYPEDDFAHMVERSKRKGYNFPYLRDESQKSAEAYGAVATPDFFVFDAGRKLRYRGKLDDSKDPSSGRPATGTDSGSVLRLPGAGASLRGGGAPLAKLSETPFKEREDGRQVSVSMI